MIDYRTTHLVERLPDYRALRGGRWIVGSMSLSSPTLRERYLLAECAFVAGDGHIYSPRDVARRWVQDHYDLARLKRRTRIDKPAPTPVLSQPYCGHGWYIDMRSAHRAIIERVGYDVEYKLNAYMTSNPVEVPSPKLVYVSLSSLAIRPVLTLSVWNGRALVVERVRNRYANTSLYYLIRDVLWGVYSDVVERCGLTVVYYNTDGCIVTNPLAVESVFEAFGEWGLEGRVKREGYVRVAGIANFAFDHDALPFPRRSRHGLTSAMPHADRAWLRERMSWARGQLETRGRKMKNSAWYASLTPSGAVNR